MCRSNEIKDQFQEAARKNCIQKHKKKKFDRSQCKTAICDRTATLNIKNGTFQ